MKKTNFVEQFNEALKSVQSATKFIETAPLKNGQTIQLFEESETQDINDMPMVSRVDKHNFYDEFGVVAVSKPKKTVLPTEVILHLEGKGEASGEKKEIALSEIRSYYNLSDFDTCALADMISKHLK